MFSNLKKHIEQLIQHKDSKNCNFVWEQLGGGSINNAFKLKCDSNTFFIKTNAKSIFENGFYEEVLGLQFLESKQVLVPQIISHGSFENSIYLILEWIEMSSENSSFWKNFAEDLAKLHQQSNNQFGLNYSNYMGQLPQKNSFFSDFCSFFVENRLKPQVKLSLDSGLLDTSHLIKFDQLYKELPTIFPIEKPSAIHGDLWSGNFLCSNNSVFLIDPAVYFGHREIDISMSLLFGGFSSEFYSYYQEVFPLENGFQNRKDYYNLYPLLIHLNLFGKSYLPSIENIIRKF